MAAPNDQAAVLVIKFSSGVGRVAGQGSDRSRARSIIAVTGGLPITTAINFYANFTAPAGIHRSGMMPVRDQSEALHTRTGTLAMGFDTALGAVVATVVLIYLLAVLARPERF
jgi:hypothetical protein